MNSFPASLAPRPSIPPPLSHHNTTNHFSLTTTILIKNTHISTTMPHIDQEPTPTFGNVPPPARSDSPPPLEEVPRPEARRRKRRRSKRGRPRDWGDYVLELGAILFITLVVWQSVAILHSKWTHYRLDNERAERDRVQREIESERAERDRAYQVHTLHMGRGEERPERVFEIPNEPGKIKISGARGGVAYLSDIGVPAAAAAASEEEETVWELRRVKRPRGN